MVCLQPGWGANATVHLFAHNQPRRAASPRPPPPEELAVLQVGTLRSQAHEQCRTQAMQTHSNVCPIHVPNWQECVRQAAAALNECVGRDLIVPHECRLPCLTYDVEQSSWRYRCCGQRDCCDTSKQAFRHSCIAY